MEVGATLYTGNFFLEGVKTQGFQLYLKLAYTQVKKES